MTKGEPLLPRAMAHRGAKAHAPENTLASLRAAADSGVGWVEFDVMLTADGVPVLFHDETLERTTGTPGRMAETSLAALRRLDAGSWFDPAFAGEPVPTLAEALDLLLARGLRPNMEIKPTAGTAAETAEAAVAVLAERWPAAAPPPLISSFETDCLAVAQRRLPGWPRGLIAEGLPADWREQAATLACRSLHLDWQRVDEAVVAAVTGAGYELAVYTVNDPLEARRLIALGVGCIITDCPDEVLAVLAA